MADWTFQPVEGDPFAVQKAAPAWKFEPVDIDPFEDGRPLTSRQAVQQLPMARTEAEAPLPPVQHIGEAAPQSLSEAIAGTLAENEPSPAATRIVEAAKEGWRGSPPVLTPEWQHWLDTSPYASNRFLYGPAAHVLSTALAAANAGFRGVQQAAVEAGAAIGMPQLGRDIAGYIEAAGMTGAPHVPIAEPMRLVGEARESLGAAAQGAPAPDALPTLSRMAQEATERGRAAEAAPASEAATLQDRIRSAQGEGLKPIYNDKGEWIGYERTEEPAPAGVTPRPEPTPPELTGAPVERVPQEPPEEVTSAVPSTASPFEVVPKEPERLASFVRRMGGMQDQGGDIAHSLGGKRYRPGLVNRNGLPDDEMALRAWESGYFPEMGENRPSINDLRDALDDDLKGRPRYSLQDEAAAAAYTSAIARNAELDRLAAAHDIPTTGITRESFLDQLTEKMSVEDLAREMEQQAQAHEDAYAEFEKQAKEWATQHPELAVEWNARDFYDQSQGRSLEDLEREYQQETAAAAAQQRPAGVAEPGPAREPAGAGEEGGGSRGSSAGVAGRSEAEAPAADLLGRPIAEPAAAPRAVAPTIRTDQRQIGLPGTEPSAVQAQAARDAGRGTLRGEGVQKPPDEGLFAPDTTGQGALYSFPGALFDPAVWRRAFGPLAPVMRGLRDSTAALGKSIGETVSPMLAGTTRSKAYAANFANALRQVNYRYGLIDRELTRNFNAQERDQMGRALDAQSVFEQQVRELPADQQAAAREQFDSGKSGLAGLTEKQRQAVDALDALSQDVWRRMRERGLVSPGAEGLPYYMPRQVLLWSEGEGFQRPAGGGGAGRGIEPIGSNLTTAGPLRREHLTPEETEAAAKGALGPSATLIRDIRSLPSRLSHAERAIVGTDLMNAIEQVGKQTGVDLVVKGDIPGMLQPADYFTIADHPSFRRWTGTGWQPVHVAKEFEGPLKAVLARRTSDLYRAAQGLKSGVMSAIMYSPFIHLAVELGRSLPVMPMRVLTLQALRDGSVLRRNLDYMDRAVLDGLSPLNRAGWADIATIADEASPVERSRMMKAVMAVPDGWHRLHQALLWDQVFNLQVGIYDAMRNKYIEGGYAPDVAGTMAAHLANRYAGALPPEHLSRAANMAANLALFSRSFTLGNLGVIKDMVNGAPSHIRARIEQMAGPEVAKSAQSALRRKAISAFVMDVGLFYMANGLLQAGLQQLRGEPAVDDWLQKSAMAIEQAKDNPLSIFGILPQHWNEPGKQDRVYAGTDSQGRGIYLRLPPGKVGEEFLGWFTKPGTLLVNKSSPLLRPVLEEILGYDTLGRQLLPPNPHTIGDYLDSAGQIVKHIAEGLGPTATIQGAHELWQQYIGGKPTQADPYVSAMKVVGPLTGVAQISQGYPGGPAAGEVHAFTERQRYDIQRAMPAIREKIRQGDLDAARADMTALGVAPALQRFYVRQVLTPGPSRRQMQGFIRNAPPEVQERATRHAP